MNWRESELTQNRRPVGGGPSGKTCPRCPEQRAQRISVRSMPRVLSGFSMMWSGSVGWKKLGQPDPEMNLASDLKSGSLQSRQM